jgi:hypothetical protein
MFPKLANASTHYCIQTLLPIPGLATEHAVAGGPAVTHDGQLLAHPASHPASADDIESARVLRREELATAFREHSCNTTINLCTMLRKT